MMDGLDVTRPKGAMAMAAHIEAIRDFYVASTAAVTGNVVFAPGVNIWFHTVIRGDLATITLGKRVNLQDGCIVHTDSDLPMTIEEGVVVGHGAILHGKFIGRDTLVGMGAILLGGCEVGEECLIAAGALVTERSKIPPRSVVMGMPGKVVRSITADELANTHSICAHYLEMAQRYVRAAYPPPWMRLNQSDN
jgi:carbonic anhydrase/acetyltransferase-like protein (isoleucine patch superfamily)